jgi:hypothetical protein
MKSKIWTQVSYLILLLGWFPFMWLSIYGSWNREIGVFIAIGGLCLCMFSSMMTLPLLRNNDLFKSIDELEEERMKYHEARKKLEKKILEL